MYLVIYLRRPDVQVDESNKKSYTFIIQIAYSKSESGIFTWVISTFIHK